MSIRYGVSLILEPAFSAGLHRARQTICSQYGGWAAEMHPIHLPLFPYFAGSDAAASLWNDGLAQAAQAFRAAAGSAPTVLSRQPALTVEGDGQGSGGGSVFLEFAPLGGYPSRHPSPAGDDPVDAGPTPLAPPSSRPETADPLTRLAGAIGQTLAQFTPSPPAAAPGWRFALLQHATLPLDVFNSAVRFAAAVVDGIGLAPHCALWEVALLRFESAATGEAWDAGGWAADLSWRIIGAHLIHPV